MGVFRTFAAVSASPYRILILASGGGSNAQRIMEHFADSSLAEVVGVVTDRKDAGVRHRAEAFGIPSRFVGATKRREAEGLLQVLRKYNPDLLVLAGYLRLIPTDVLSCFPERVINIHPALLPKFGGPGMYGSHVHAAVAKTRQTHSGITVHLANEAYDEGRILFQATTQLNLGDDAETIASKVLALEHQHYSLVLEAYLRQLTACR